MKHPSVEMYTYTSTNDMLIWHRDIIYVSLFPIMSCCRWRFWEPPPPQSKGSRIFPGSSQGNFAPFPPPPAQRPCSATKLRASCFQHYPESSLQTGKMHPPWGSGFTCIFLPGNFLLTWHKNRSVLCPVHHQTEVSWGKPWMAHWAWSSPGY